MPLISTALAIAAIAQLPQDGKPLELTTLRPGELVRMYEYGGLTRRGVYRSLLVITDSGKVFLKNQNGGYSSRLQPNETSELTASIKAADWKAARSNPRTDGISPSAYDGQDLYLALRSGKAEIRWSNVQFHAPEGFPLLEQLRAIQSRTRGDR